MSSLVVRLITSVFAALLMIGGALSAASGQANGEFAVFNAHDPQSTTVITYRDWNRFLKTVVFDVGPSHRYRPLPDTNARTGTKLLSRRARSRSWLEGNRVRFHLLGDNTQVFLDNYRNGMVKVAEDEDITTWRRDEQLTFWLNLHNLLVMKVAAEEYPFTSANRFHDKRWNQDMVTIKGVPLSIQDIQDEIVLAIWDDPMVIYGLFQGAVGGPGIRPLAFRSASIWLSLSRNGKEFVNSNRGINTRGKKIRVSKFYDWTRRAFPDFEQDLRQHMMALANAETAAILERPGNLRASYFDWAPADFYGGRMADGMDSNVASRSAVTAAEAELERWNGGVEVTGSFMGFQSLVPLHSTPAHTRDFMRALQVKFRAFDMPQKGQGFAEMMRPAFSGTVTVVEMPRVEGKFDRDK